MEIEKYAAFVCLCHIVRTPEEEINRFKAEQAKDPIGWEEEGLIINDFEYSIRNIQNYGQHYFSRKEVEGLLAVYGSTPSAFWGKEKAQKLGF